MQHNCSSETQEIASSSQRVLMQAFRQQSGGFVVHAQASGCVFPRVSPGVPVSEGMRPHG
eukprot:1763486-Amphidinium_carterae.1